ncbi:sodium:proton antiporter [Planomonospora parontospora subsp. parontospora]|uniref:Sodium:proton antiporter n=2 Tax=Planomonospora parontospora TaxID=58119 RepID=A0AA37BPH5_9ACTN|nr:cation:proton antiporter [Planomonospora parontospora]GGK99594.1 sodium:proton antiporter [Planomonospora parontospora]GII13008.1 sodium:proton antiporter [Planomonospora parontospora subsp. parontospora]
MLDVLLSVVGALALIVALLSGYVHRLVLSTALLALLTGIVFGPAVLGVIDLPTVVEGHQEIHELSRVLLAVSVMAVALRYPTREVRPCTRPVVILLTAAMIGMALITTAVASAVLGVGLGAAALLGAALCPTDPVLASSAVTGEPAEREIAARTRRLLSLESGANDGLALPLVLAAIAIAGTRPGTGALLESLWQVMGAVAFGAVTGRLGERVLRGAEKGRTVESGPLLLYTVLLALFVLGAAGLLNLDGVLAVFVAGLAFNAASSRGERLTEVKIDEVINHFLLLPLFVVFGAMLPWQEWGRLGWRGLVLVVGVLLLRRLPVLLALKKPLSLRWRDAVFMGWFGPIGVSALFYLTLEAHRLGADPLVLAAGTLVVAASTAVHGVTTAMGLVLYRKANAEKAAR